MLFDGSMSVQVARRTRYPSLTRAATMTNAAPRTAEGPPTRQRDTVAPPTSLMITSLAAGSTGPVTATCAAGVRSVCFGGGTLSWCAQALVLSTGVPLARSQ